MSKPYRPRRDFDGLEARRMKAAKCFAEGKLSQAEISRRLEVSRTSVHRWYHGWLEEGRKALRKAGRAGRLPRIGKQELLQLDRALRRGAIAHGFATEMWTLPRVARLIEDLTGVRYHPAHVWRILHGMDWTVQRPARRAKERNEKEIQRWIREDWPRVKKTPAASAPGWYSRTRRGSRTARRSGALGRREDRRRS